jgi:glycosyltransferase involved in cell wall biosynthesis
MTPLRILQTCFSRSWGGLEIQALEVSLQLHRRGHQVWLACCPDSRLFHETAAAGLSATPFNVTGYIHPYLILRLSRFIRRERVNIIHSHLSRDIATLVPAMKLARRTVPLVLSKRVGSYINKKDLLHRFSYAHVRRVLAISDVIHNNVLSTTPIPPDRVITLHDAIDTEHFSLSRADRNRVRKEFRIPEDAILVGFVGRFSPGKGHEEFLRAADLLRKRFPMARFLIAGEASYGEEAYERDIHNLSRDLHLDDIVIFAGFRKDVPDVLSAFDIFAFPSHAESFGVALIEAMAMERPVVSTNCDGVLDIVIDGVTGIFVHPRNAAELADALARLIIDPALRLSMGRAGRRRVETLFDQKAHTAKLEELYRDLVEHPS